MGRILSFVVLVLAAYGVVSFLGGLSDGSDSTRQDPPDGDPEPGRVYVCADGRQVSDRQDCETDTQYVCPDNSIVADPQDCETDEPVGDPPQENPPQQDQEYEVAHGDILADWTCHIRVSGPNQPVRVSSSGTYEVKRVYASSARELQNQVEMIRQGAANHAGMPFPDG